MNKKILEQDALEIIYDKGIPYDKLEAQTILVTGATGLLGSAIVRSLILANKKYNLHLQVIAVVRSKQKAEKMFDCSDKSLVLVKQDICDKFTVEYQVDYIIHGASVTNSKDFVKQPVETIKTTLKGTENILEFAKKSHVKSVVYLSSMEVYGKISEKENPIKENQYGYIDILQTRSSYSEGKKMAECICISYKEEYQVPIKIVRLTQIMGAGVSYEDNRVFAEFARCLKKGEDIILHTSGNTIRNCCYLTDAVRGIFYVMMKGIDGEAYNIANDKNTFSIKEMAERVCRMSQSDMKVIMDVCDEKQFGYNPEMITILDIQKIGELGWKAQISLEESYHRIVSAWDEE